MSDCVQDSLWDSWLACQRGQFQRHDGGGEVFGIGGALIMRRSGYWKRYRVGEKERTKYFINCCLFVDSSIDILVQK